MNKVFYLFFSVCALQWAPAMSAYDVDSSLNVSGPRLYFEDIDFPEPQDCQLNIDQNPRRPRPPALDLEIVRANGDGYWQARAEEQAQTRDPMPFYLLLEFLDVQPAAGLCHRTVTCRQGACKRGL